MEYPLGWHSRTSTPYGGMRSALTRAGSIPAPGGILSLANDFPGIVGRAPREPGFSP